MSRKLLILTALAAATPAAGQTLLDQILAKAVKPRAATPGQLGSFAAAMTPDQQAALDRLLAQPLLDRRVAADRQEADQVIRAVVATGACASGPSAWNAVNRFHMTPHTYDNDDIVRVPMWGLRYHDRTRCLDVQRLSDWAKPANNALRFTASYVAADSGEAKRQAFVLQKQSDGGWLIKDVGIMLD